MSLCSISDVSQKELLDLSINAFNTSSRIKLAEPYRTDISLYMPPKGLFGHINKIFNIEPEEEYLKIDLKAQLRRIWAASVTSYIFRFKPDVEQLFNARNSHIIKQMALGPTW